jgi:AcrR family transcriptional regulator
VAARAQPREFLPRKWPSQRRSRETFEAVVEACTWLLPRLGYAGTTTNHIADRAGVNISSLYEYFPGKDAIVAQVAERLVERVLRRLARGAPRVMDEGEDRALRAWIQLIHDTVAREKDLVAVFVDQVPYTQQLAPMQELRSRLLGFSQELQGAAGDFVRPGFSPAQMHLVVNLVTSTISQLVLDPPQDVEPEELLDELALRLEEWIRGDGASSGPV